MFIGPGGLRAGWRLLLFAAIYFVMTRAVYALLRAMLHPARGTTLSWYLLLVGEGIGFGCLLFAAWVMGHIEQRPMRAYGLPGARAFRRNFWAGCVWGAVSVSALLLAIWGAHGFSFGEIALAPAAAVRYGVLWLLGFLAVALFEEFSARGYAQFTLTTGIGFWPAAVVISALFGAAHLGNPGEAWTGAASAALIGLWLALTLRRTGDLWFAIGFHTVFDYGETFAYSVPNSGVTFSGHLLNADLHGPPWITGGTVGPEGSMFAFIMIGLLFVVFDRVYREKRFPVGEALPTQQNTVERGDTF